MPRIILIITDALILSTRTRCRTGGGRGLPSFGTGIGHPLCAHDDQRRQAMRLTNITWEMYTNEEFSGFNAEQRGEVVWPHLFWATDSSWVERGASLQVFARGRDDNMYELRLEMPIDYESADDSMIVATQKARSFFQSCSCPDHIYRGRICKRGIAALYQMAEMVSRFRSRLRGLDMFPPSTIPSTGRVRLNLLEDQNEATGEMRQETWERLRRQVISDQAAQFPDITSVLRRQSEYVADQLLAWGRDEVDESDDEIVIVPDPRRAADFVSEPAPSAAAAGPQPLLTRDLGTFVGLLDAAGAQAEAFRMLEDATSVSRIYMTAYTFDRVELKEKLLAAARLGATVRLMVDQKMTMAGKTCRP